MYLVSVLNKKMKQDRALERTCSGCLGKAMVNPTWQASRGKAKPLPSVPIFSSRMFPMIPKDMDVGFSTTSGATCGLGAAQQSQQLIQNS